MRIIVFTETYIYVKRRWKLETRSLNNAGKEREVSVTDTKEKEILDTGLSLCHDSMKHDAGRSLYRTVLFQTTGIWLFSFFHSILSQSVWTSVKMHRKWTEVESGRFLATHNLLNGIWPQLVPCRNSVCIRQKVNTLKLYGFINIITRLRRWP